MSTRQEDLVKEPQNQAHEATHEVGDAAASRVKEAEEQVAKLADKAKGVAATAQTRLYDGKDKAATIVDQAAQAIRERSEKAGSAGDTLASSLEKTSEYVREHDTPTMANDIGALIKKHPLQAAAAAVVAYIFIRHIL